MKKYAWSRTLVICSLMFGVVVSAAEIRPLPSGKAWREGFSETGSEKQERFMPQLRENTVICGNKKLEVGKNGTLTLWADSDLLMEIAYCFSVKDRKTGAIRWISTGSRFMDPASSVLRRDGGSFTFNGFVKEENKPSWKVIEQRLKLLPDGQLRFELTWFPPEDTDLEFISSGVLCMLPSDTAEKKSLILNDQKVIMTADTEKMYLATDSSQTFRYTIFVGDPAKEFSLSSTYAETFGTSFSTILDKTKKRYRLSLGGNKNKRQVSFLLDLRKGTSAKISRNIRGGIDFKSIDDLEMPYAEGKNLLRNPSFEQGFHGYNMRQPYNTNRCSPELWKMKLFEIDDSVSRFGKSSLKLQTPFKKCIDYRALYTTDSLCSPLTIVTSGTYTLSCYAKGDQGKGQELNLWIPHFSTGNRTLAMPGAQKAFRLTDEWQRFEFTFKVPVTMPLNLRLNGNSITGRGNIWVDGLQLEKGEKATTFEIKPVEGRLYSSSEENFIETGKKINARLRLTAKPEIRGKAAVTVTNFFQEEVFSGTFTFAADRSGTAEISLPLDEKLGKGIFMIRCEYEADGGEKCYDIHRLTVSDFLKNEHPLRRIFSSNYGSDWARFDFLRMLDRYKKIGIGTQHHIKRWDRDIYEELTKHGISGNNSFMGCDILESGSWQKKIGFGIRRRNDPARYLTYPDCPELLVRDFHQDSGGKITPEYLEKFSNAARTIAAEYPWVTLWTFQGELKARFPNSWWSSEGTEEKASAAHAKILKAFVDGIRKGNPKAKVFQDDPCNMSPAGGIAETDKLLEETNKLGVKFDVIGIHPYRYSPENPDLDEDTQAFLKVLEKRGYAKVPIFWPEMMHWGPYDIPQWNIVSADWGAKAWDGALGALSYDMGWTEKLSAAWRARSWLTALKYSDRVLSAESGNTNNFALDLDLTPFASQMMSNTLGNLLGDSHFKKDIRFAPFIRCYIFEDAQKRPVAALWCHQERVDSGRVDAPYVEADFGSSLEGVFDLMNQPRTFQTGKFSFPVTPFPVFLRGRPGTFPVMEKALEDASLVSGEGISPVLVSSYPVSPETMKIIVKNLVSREIVGTLNGRSMMVKPSGSESLLLPLPAPLKDSEIRHQQVPVSLKMNKSEFSGDSSFDALLCMRVKDGATLSGIDWKSIPSVSFTKHLGKVKTTGAFRVAWNTSGLFLEVNVKDMDFVHEEYPRIADRWNNDCLQVYIDTLGDARSKLKQGYDENDYEYGIFPNRTGNSSIVYRARLVDQQLGLGTSAPKENTVAEDIPSTFSKYQGGYTYRVFFPAKYLLPVRLKKGHVMGFGLFVPNVDSSEKKGKGITSAMTIAVDGKGCFNRPNMWPAMLLWE